VFRSIVEIVFAAWVLLVLLNAQYRPRWTVLLLSITTFVGIVALADIFGENPAKSIWSNFERMDGLVTQVHLLAYMLVAGTVLTTEKLWLWFWRVSIGVSAFVSIYALIQFFATSKTRLDATLGNPIYLAIYAVFFIFIVLMMLARSEIKRGEQIAYLVLLPFLGAVLFLTATRGATLGLLGGMLLASIGIAFSYRKVHAVRTAALVVGMILLVGMGSFYLARNTAFVRENQVLNRFATLSLTENTVYARTLVWGMAIEGVKEKPLLGWGQENFNLVFNTHYDPRMYAQEQWFDRTHNFVFDWLIAAGILGLLAYLSIFLATLWTIYRTQEFNVIQKWLLFGLLAAYGFHNLTVFDNVTSYLLFFTVLAWVYAQATDVWSVRAGKTPQPKEVSEKTLTYIATPIAVVVLCWTIWAVNLVPLQVSKDLLNALKYAQIAQAHVTQNNDVAAGVSSADTALEYFKKAEAAHTYGTQEVREQWAQTAGVLAGTTWLPNEKKTQWYETGIAALSAQSEIAPEDARFPFLLGALHERVGNFAAAQESYQKALTLSPGKQAILMSLAASEANSGNDEGAVAYARQAFEEVEEYTKARVLYATVLARNKDVAEAFRLMEAAPEYAADKGVLSAFVRNGSYEDARKLWEVGLTYTRDNVSPDVLFALTQVYMQTGDTARATQEVKYIQGKYPGLETITAQALEEIKKFEAQQQ